MLDKKMLEELKNIAEDETLDEKTRMFAYQISTIHSIINVLDKTQYSVNSNSESLKLLYAKYTSLNKKVKAMELGTYILVLSLIIISIYAFIIK